MVEVVLTERFERIVRKIRDAAVQEKIKKQILKISENPESGKPLRYDLKGARAIRVHPFRMIYVFKEGKVYLLDFGHRGDIYG